jgi:hypothetical protein
MATSPQSVLVVALLALLGSAFGAQRAAGAELIFSIIDRQEVFGRSGTMCENVGSPPDEMRCIGTDDHRLVGQRLLLDFGQPVSISGFANLLPRTMEEYFAEPGGSFQFDPAMGEFQAESNERETLYFLSAPEWSLEHVLAQAEATANSELGLHAEFSPVVARYVLWSAGSSFDNRREGTSFWSHVTRGPHGRVGGLRFYGEFLAVPEPASRALLLLGAGLAAYGGRRRRAPSVGRGEGDRLSA